MADKVIHVHTPAELDAQLKGSGLVVIDYSATWCGPCRAIAPTYAALSTKYATAVFVHVDVDELKGHPIVSGISSVPTFHFYKNGAKVSEFSGANSTTLEDTIKANL